MQSFVITTPDRVIQLPSASTGAAVVWWMLTEPARGLKTDASSRAMTIINIR
jgi:hypothetical protein